jgi:hypothetical protein
LVGYGLAGWRELILRIHAQQVIPGLQISRDLEAGLDKEAAGVAGNFDGRALIDLFTVAEQAGAKGEGRIRGIDHL